MHGVARGTVARPGRVSLFRIRSGAGAGDGRLTMHLPGFSVTAPRSRNKLRRALFQLNGRQFRAALCDFLIDRLAMYVMIHCFTSASRGHLMTSNRLTWSPPDQPAPYTRAACFRRAYSTPNRWRYSVENRNPKIICRKLLGSAFNVSSQFWKPIVSGSRLK